MHFTYINSAYNEITKMFFPVIFEIVNDYTGFFGK